MVVDTSAIMALLLGEPEAAAIAARLADAERSEMSAATFVETSSVTEARLGPNGVLKLQQVMREAEVRVVDVTEGLARMASDAWRRFGKGRHPAALNFGDTFSYALAREQGESLLCVGRDFVQTDIDVVPLVDGGG